MKHRYLLFLALLALKMAPAQAQDIPGFVRVLALGDRAPFNAKIVGGVRKQQPPVPGETPPNLLNFEVEERAPQKMLLNLDRITPWVEMGSNALPIKLTTEGGAKWGAIPAPLVPTLAVFVKDQSKKKLHWDHTKAVYLKDTLADFPNGTIRVVNLSHKKIAVKIGDNPNAIAIAVKGVKVFSKDDGVKEGLMKLDIRSAKEGGGWQKGFSNRIRMRQGERMNIFAHAGDQENKTRSEIRFKQFPERGRDPR